jgi:NAD(P)-dependent dehydrogenase (short-subunit alcohol dehydrogenase family)
VDVSDVQSVQRLVDDTTKEFGSIDYLVHAASVGRGKFFLKLGMLLKAFQVDQEHYVPIPDDDLHDFARVMSINGRGTLLISRAVSKVMAKQEPKTFESTLSKGPRDIGRGAIVLVTSALSYTGIPGKVGYVASKHAALGIFRTLGKTSHSRKLFAWY